MSVFTTRPRLRWAVPALAVATVLGGGVLSRSLAATAGPLPERSPAQLLADLGKARLDGLSGTVVHRADLGLPPLPMPSGSQGLAQLVSFASGSHTMRVWYSGPAAARLSVIGTYGQTDIIRNGRDLWTWSSQANTASHETLPEHTAGAARPAGAPTPQDAAQRALAAVTPTTEVTVSPPVRVAGRTAYELVLRPKDPRSLVGQVRVAIDGERYLPLRVAVFAAGAEKPAVETGFTAVNFDRPEASQFRFTPPPGAKITEEPAAGAGAGSAKVPAPPGTGEPAVVGEGWTSVLVLRLPAGDPDGSGMVEAVTAGLPKVSGPWGTGRVLRGKLFSALLTDDGRLLVGAVAQDALTSAAADRAARPGAAR